jgi:N-methylhydantoinase B
VVSEIDMIALQVVTNALHSITDEMNMALVRTAYSTNIKDRRDCSCAIYLPNGDVVSQSELGAPVHLGIMPSAIDSVLNRFSLDEMEEGDHIVTNVPYPTGPGHLNDVTMVSPVFIDGSVVFLVANMAHHVDLGGFAPGSMAIGLKEIFQEALQIPPVKLVKKGVVDRELLDFMKQNVRTSIEMDGDIHAQMACNNVGRKRLQELASRYGTNRLVSFIHEMFDYSERRIRTGLREIPNGSYSFEDYIEGTQRTQELIKIKVVVTIGDDEITFDFNGTDAQVNDSFNGTRGSAVTACYYIVKALIDPGLPPNVGSYRPLHVIVPDGTVVGARLPAAIGNATIIISPKVVDVLLGALVAAIPSRAAAASNGVTTIFNIGGVDNRSGHLYNYVETYAGGQGAMHNQDGMDAVQCHMTNTRNAPVEVIETTYPLLIKSYGLVPDSDGPGEFRGGLGMRREIQIGSQGTTLTIATDRSKLRPWGVFGGRGGGNSSCTIVHSSGESKRLEYSKMTLPVNEGETVILCTPGAGGWGEPGARDPERVLWDVVEGLISAERAASEYGVALRRLGNEGFEIDKEATNDLRRNFPAAAQMSVASNGISRRFGDAQRYDQES